MTFLDHSEAELTTNAPSFSKKSEEVDEAAALRALLLSQVLNFFDAVARRGGREGERCANCQFPLKTSIWFIKICSQGDVTYSEVPD